MHRSARATKKNTKPKVGEGKQQSLAQVLGKRVRSQDADVEPVIEKELSGSTDIRVLPRVNRKQQEDDDIFVPTHLHKVVIYNREGEKLLSEGKKAVYQFVKENFVIPRDFEASHKYGPLSGVSYEERVVAAYLRGLLDVRDGVEEDDEELKMCYTCSGRGHFPEDCPDGF